MVNKIAKNNLDFQVDLSVHNLGVHNLRTTVSNSLFLKIKVLTGVVS